MQLPKPGMPFSSDGLSNLHPHNQPTNGKGQKEDTLYSQNIPLSLLIIFLFPYALQFYWKAARVLVKQV
uniref:Uncharacterized protein n=1 Tax=Rhizophora mucronata TaxID=61149 RepID=A0A2P2MUP8_RHIMU